MATGYGLFIDRIFISYLPVASRQSPFAGYYYLCRPDYKLEYA
jgi:hypothetical protein